MFTRDYCYKHMRGAFHAQVPTNVRNVLTNNPLTTLGINRSVTQRASLDQDSSQGCEA